MDIYTFIRRKICMYIHIYIYTYISLYIYMHMYICVYICIYLYTYKYIHRHIYVCARTHSLCMTFPRPCNFRSDKQHHTEPQIHNTAPYCVIMQDIATKRHTTQHNTTQNNTTQHNTTQHSATQCNTLERTCWR